MSYRPTVTRAVSSHRPVVLRRPSAKIQLLQPSAYTPSYRSSYAPPAYGPSYTSRLVPQEPQVVIVTRAPSTVNNDYRPSSRITGSTPGAEWAHERNENAKAAYEALERQKAGLYHWEQAVVLKGQQLEAARKNWERDNTHLNKANATYNASLGYGYPGGSYTGGSRRPLLTNTLVKNRKAAEYDNQKAQSTFERLDRESKEEDQDLIQLGRRLEAARQNWDSTVKELKSANHRAGLDGTYYSDHSDYSGY